MTKMKINSKNHRKALVRTRHKESEGKREPEEAEVNSIVFDEPFQDLFVPARYKVYYGGRGGAKSWAMARALILQGSTKKMTILCSREIQTSISDSVFRLLAAQIEALGLSDFYSVTKTSIKGLNGTEFIFKGLKYNIAEIKSTEGINVCWIEEAQSVSDESWDTLIPTIREKDSEIWISFNPGEETDPTYMRFVLDPPPEALVHKVSWRDNSFFPDVLKAELEYLKKVDYDKYMHVWEGEPKTLSDAVIFKGKYRVDVFAPPSEDTVLYYGADWGFSQDPTVLVRCWIKNKVLYIDQEVHGIGIELDDIPAKFKSMPGLDKRWMIYADSSRPETISHVRNKGNFRMEAANKWTGSVEDGIAYLRSFEEIVIHERCKNIIDEAKFYKYKVDPKTGDVTPIIIDKNNHCWDAIRYALHKLIKNKKKKVRVYSFNGEEM